MAASSSEALVPLPDRDAIAIEHQHIADHVMQARGGTTLGKVFRALANSPRALETVAAVGEFSRYEAELDPELRELATLTVAQECRCVYEWTAHWRIAERLNVDTALLNTIGTPEIEQRPAPLGPTLRYARLVAQNDPVDDATAQTLLEQLGPKVLVELTVLVGYYGMLARVLNTLRVPLEDGVEAVPFVINA